MTNYTVKVRADQGNAGTNKIEVFLDTDPKQEIMILTDRADDIDEYEDEPRPEDTALYYAVERIAELEKQLNALANAVSPALEDYANAIDCMEYPEEAAESRDLHHDLKNALADAKQVLSR